MSVLRFLSVSQCLSLSLSILDWVQYVCGDPSVCVCSMRRLSKEALHTDISTAGIKPSPLEISFSFSLKPI